MVLANELAPPRRQMHFPTVAFVIVENLELPYRAGGIERHGIIDELVLADDLIEEEPATGAVAPGIDLRIRDLDAGIALDGLHLRGRQFAALGCQYAAVEHERLRLFHRQ